MADHYDEPCIRVSTILRPSTYKALRELAGGREISIGGVLSVVADQALSDRRGLGMPSRETARAAADARRVEGISADRRGSLSRDDVAEAIRLNDEGQGWVEIAERFGVTRNAVALAASRARKQAQS